MCLVILLGFSGFVFYTGWTQFKVPAGQVGIVVSKTSGISQTPVTNDKFSWSWEFLLPTNARLELFSPKTESFSQTVSGSLPSAKEYARIFNGEADFSYALEFSVEAKASLEQTRALLRDGDIKGQEDLDKVLARSAENFAALAAQKILTAALSDTGCAFEDAQKIAGQAAKDFSSEQGAKVQVAAVTLKKYSVPDIALYKKAAASYEEFAASMAISARASAQREAEENSRFKTTMQKMESLGETLKKYPELSDMIKNSDNINKTLQTIDSIE